MVTEPSLPSTPRHLGAVEDRTVSAQMGQSKLASTQPILVENRRRVPSPDVKRALAQLPLPAGATPAPPDPHPSLRDPTCSQNASRVNGTSHRASSRALVGAVLGLRGVKVGRATAPTALTTALRAPGMLHPSSDEARALSTGLISSPANGL